MLPNIHHLNVGLYEFYSLNYSFVQLSLRDNPLVVRFVSDMTHNPPSLLELAARVIMTNNIQYDGESIPRNLVEYLNSGHRCVNSKCKGQCLSLIQSSKFYRLYHHRHRFSFYYNPLQYHRYQVHRPDDKTS